MKTEASGANVAATSIAIQRPPSLCMKPIPASSPTSPDAGSPPVTLTSKEWVVPPRPKPGRKPATDTPPTKRKAQNRAAQRAFRERRAARVGELEEQLKEIEDQNEQHQDNLRAKITELDDTLRQCRSDLDLWRTRCQKLETELVKAREQISQQQTTSTSQPQSTSGGEAQDVNDPHSIGCGNCTLESHCQCIDDVVHGLGDNTKTDDRGERPPLLHTSPHKRIKLDPAEYQAMEIDFTNAVLKGPTAPPKAHTSVNVADPCGFCSDGTPCICAEMAAEQNHANATRSNSPVAIHRSSQRRMAQFTPPPSEGDVANSSISAMPNCTSNPGTCAQCRADPNSTLFCKSLAASREKTGVTPGGCCGNRDGQNGCCQSSVPLPPRNSRTRSMANSEACVTAPGVADPLRLSCADAYTALSRHSGYEQASTDMASWMPKLHANPVGVEGRPALEIDAANVMAVLKDFDRRFGASK